MTTATTTTKKRAEANRRNARKSTGPRTPEGKDRSKFNAIKHGLNAKTLVLPGEDAGAFQDRLDAWEADLQPRNDVEQVLVERSATLSWQLERADRADAARLASILGAAPAEEALRQADRAAALGQRLFQDPGGPLPLYPHSLYGTHDRPRISDSGLGDDPDAPARLLLQLESTAAGCGWLLDRWGELGGLLDRGLSWQSPDKLKAIRLLGRQPMDAADSEVVALIFQACHVLDPQPRHASGAERNQAQTLAEAIRALDVMGKDAFSLTPDRGDELGFDPEGDEDSGNPAEPGAAEDLEDFGDLEAPDGEDDEDKDDLEARIEWQRCGAAFAELRGELTGEEAHEYRRRLQGRRVDELRPRDPVEARAKLRGIVDKAVSRLEARREVHEQWASVMEANELVRLSFDASPEGERLRRFQLAGNRALLRTLETLRKFRNDGDCPQSDLADAASRSACVSDPAETVDRTPPVELPEAPGPNPGRSQEDGPPGEPSILPGIAPRRPVEIIDLPIAKNEPTTGAARDIPAETASAVDRRDARNEPTAPVDNHDDPRVQPTAASDDLPIARNEPIAAPTSMTRSVPSARSRNANGAARGENANRTRIVTQ
jgi:hypothetical protein